jgi:hypothetical protein
MPRLPTDRPSGSLLLVVDIEVVGMHQMRGQVTEEALQGLGTRPAIDRFRRAASLRRASQRSVDSAIMPPLVFRILAN